MKDEYFVTITETRTRTARVKADTKEEAERMLECAYNRDAIVLGQNDVSNIEVVAQKRPKIIQVVVGVM